MPPRSANAVRAARRWLSSMSRVSLQVRSHKTYEVVLMYRFTEETRDDVSTGGGVKGTVDEEGIRLGNVAWGNTSTPAPYCP